MSIPRYAGLDYPVQKSVPTTVSDQDDLAFPARKLWLNVSFATLKVILVGNQDTAPTTYKNVPAGSFERSVRRILATGTATSDSSSVSAAIVCEI